MTDNHDIGGGYKYSAKDLSLSQIVAIVNSDHDTRGTCSEMAEGWRAAAAFAERLRTDLDGSKETLTASFDTPNSEVFFGYVTDIIASAEAAVTPAEMNAEALEGAVVEVERLKPIIDDLVAEDALYDENRGEMAAEDAGNGLTEYDAAKADVLAEAQDQFGIADQQFAGQRFAMDAPTVFNGPQWHGPDRISDMDGYRHAYHPGGPAVTGAGGSGGPQSMTGSIAPTPSSAATPQLQSTAPVAPPTAVGPTPAPPVPGGAAAPATGLPPVMNPPGQGMPARTPPSSPPLTRPAPSPSARPTPSPTPRPVPTQLPHQRGATPPGYPAERNSGQSPAQRPSGPSARGTQPASRSATPTTRSNPPATAGRPAARQATGASPVRRAASASPRGVVKPNAGFEQSISRNLPRSVPSVVGGRADNGVKPVTRPVDGGRVVGTRTPTPKSQFGSLTRNGVVANNRKPSAVTWSRSQPVRQVSVPRSGVFGRREYFISNASRKTNERQARHARRKARLARLNGTAAPEQHEIMAGITDHTTPGIIGGRRSLSTA